MARKRRVADSVSLPQQLAERIRKLQAGERPSNPALDALTGKRTIEELAAVLDRPATAVEPVEELASPPDATTAEPPRAAGPLLMRKLKPSGAPAPAVAPPAGPIPRRVALTPPPAVGAAGHGSFRRTVYLSRADLEDLAFLLKHWPVSSKTRPSRSQLIRVAIRALRMTVEEIEHSAGSVPNATTGVSRASESTE